MKVFGNNNTINMTCEKCESRLGVGVDDITMNEIIHNCSEYEAICPCCGAKIAIPSEKVKRKGWVSRLSKKFGID